MTIFVDASVFCAYANLDDVHHQKAKKIMNNIVSGKYGHGITTDYIFDETVTVVLRRIDKKNAAEVGNLILHSEINLVGIDPMAFQRAWELFQKTENLSFTDCTSIAFMRMFGIQNIATFDKEFSKIRDIQVVGG